MSLHVCQMHHLFCFVHVHCFRMVTFSNNVEPANGFLVRYLHRKLMEAEDPKSVTNEDLLQNLDWVPRLWYHLHTFLEKHSTSDFLIGNLKYHSRIRIDSLQFQAEDARKVSALYHHCLSDLCGLRSLLLPLMSGHG